MVCVSRNETFFRGLIIINHNEYAFSESGFLKDVAYERINKAVCNFDGDEDAFNIIIRNFDADLVEVFFIHRFQTNSMMDEFKYYGYVPNIM